MSRRCTLTGPAGRDRGLTLPELLITVSILGIVVTVLSSAVVVSLRQQASTEGRLNVARDEQAIGFVMPSDLASASEVTTDPQVTPCDGPPVCDGIDLSNGSNVVMLSWTTESDGVETQHHVSYHFAPSGDGFTYTLSRVACESEAEGPWSCSSRVVMRDLPGPPDGAPFVPGVAMGAACVDDPAVVCTRPDWVIVVSQPLAPDAVSYEQEDESASELTDEEIKDANRVVVSIDGGGNAPGAGGGLNQVNITAGGTVRDEIDANSLAGTPAFVAARSRCGGPVTLVVDDSGSIDMQHDGSGPTPMQQVRNGVRAFVESLAGTPSQIQIVRFDRYSSALGSSDWHRYYDMTDPAEVTQLVNQITPSNLWSNGGTNWEDALFRTFHEEDGSVAATFPETVVFFTDGMPTWNQLEYRSSSKPLPPEPPAPLPGTNWERANGSRYNQTSFNRADYIANRFASRTNLIGVGVGTGIDPKNKNNVSTWVEDPGGLVDVAERGSYSHVRTETYYARFQVRENRKWVTVDLATYEADDGRRRYRRSNGTWRTVRPGRYSPHDRHSLGWFQVPKSEYDAADTTSADDHNDGLYFSMDVVPISRSEYEQNADEANYQQVDKTWSATGPDWEVWTDEIEGDPDTYRFTQSDRPAVEYDLKNASVLARLVADTDTGIPAEVDPATGRYANVETANMYVLPDWDQFPDTMKQIALGECGGTLTLKTELAGSGPAQDPFKYQSGEFLDAGGDPLDIEPRFVETSGQFITGTFDLTIPDGNHLTVEILPQNLSDLTDYQPSSWSCRAGVDERPFELVDIADSPWKGIRVRVGANEAVSCTQTVTR